PRPTLFPYTTLFRSLGLDQRRTARFIGDLREIAIFVVPRKRVTVARDPDDDRVMECALEAGADFIVTGNIRDFPAQFHGVRAVTPRDFLFVLGSSPNPFYFHQHSQIGIVAGVGAE